MLNGLDLIIIIINYHWILFNFHTGDPMLYSLYLFIYIYLLSELYTASQLVKFVSRSQKLC